MTEHAPRTAWLPVALVAGLAVFCVLLNLQWERRGAPSFGGFDEVNHLGRIFAFAEQQDGRAVNVERDQPLHWPPPFHEIAAQVWRATGHSHLALKALWWAMYALLIAVAFLLAREFTDRWGALLAATLTATALPVATYSRVISLDMPLTLTVAVTLLALVRSRGFRHLAWSVGFGIAAGTSCLAKGYAPVYWLAAAAVAFFVGGSWRDLNKKGYENPLFNLAIGSVFGAFTISWWYGGKMAQWLAVLTGHVSVYQDAGGRIDGAWSIPTMLYGDLGPLFWLLLIAGVVLAWPLRRARRGVYEMSVFVVVPPVLFAVAPTTYARFVMPVVIGAATLFAAGLRALPWPRATRAIAWAVAVLALALHTGLALSPYRAAEALGLFAHAAQSDAQAVSLTRQAAAVGPLVVIDDAWHPYLPGAMVGYLVRLADGDVPVTVADTARDDEATVVAALGDVPSAQAVLLLREGATLAIDETVLADFTVVERAQWAYGARRPRLELWTRNASEKKVDPSTDTAVAP